MRRELKFRNFNDARKELERLGPGPVETTGLWSYYQILTHCALGFENSMKGIEREMSWWKKHVSGPLRFQGMVLKGSIPMGIKGNPQTTYTERVEGDAKAAMDKLLQVMAEFEKFERKISIHPRVGKLSKKNWLRFHALHLANHLGYTKLKD